MMDVFDHLAEANARAPGAGSGTGAAQTSEKARPRPGPNAKGPRAGHSKSADGAIKVDGFEGIEMTQVASPRGSASPRRRRATGQDRAAPPRAGQLCPAAGNHLSLISLRDRLEMTVGINTAEVFVGNIGADARMKYSVLGDGVNLASRVEGLNRKYGTALLVAHGTWARPVVRAAFLCRPIDCVAVKGKDIGAKIYEVMARQPEARKGRAVAEASAAAMAVLARL